jgi:hypothetical protein
VRAAAELRQQILEAVLTRQEHLAAAVEVVLVINFGQE